METIFTKILAGQIPIHKVYEDDQVLAFLDINPLAQGHVVLIPKEAKKTLAELSDESAAALGRVLPRLCRAVVQVSGCTDYNVLQNNGVGAHQAVFHVHFHIIPKPSEDAGLGVVWPALRLEREAGASLSAAFQAALGQAI